MKKLLALVVALSFGVAGGAQTQRARRSRIPTGNRARGVPAKDLTPTAPTTSAPIFLGRRGVATINEMMIQPPAFSYGSSINIWILKDKSGRTREIAETGHADSATCRRVSSQLISLFLEKNKEAEDLVVAGASHFVDHGEPGIAEVLLKQPRVQEFISARRELWAAEQVVSLWEDSPGEGTDDKSVLQKAREALVLAQRRVEDMRNDPLIQEYLRASSSAEAINTFISEVGRFSHENGLVNIREIPFEPIEQARARIATAAASSRAQVISFEDLLQASGVHEAALFTPVLTVPGGRPVELRIPLASLHTANFDEAQRNNRDEVERALVGNANDRLGVFNDAKARYLQDQRDCDKLSAEELRKMVVLTQVCTAEGVCYKTDKPERITMREYCTIRLPLNLKLVDGWIGRTKGLLKTIKDDGERKDGSRILAFDYATLVDSMLRDWRLPVPRSQVAFDNWRGAARGPVWSLLTAQLSRIGIAPDVIGGEQMVFSVQLDGQELVVRPVHVIDMARSVLVADPASGATRVLDAWSMRSSTTAVTAPIYVSSEVEGLVSDSIRLLAAGDRDDAEARIAAAFSRDPAAAFRSVEREWLGQFPDTHERMLKTQESLKPFVEAIEWKEALETIKSDPSSKEGIRLEIEALHAFLESYPKAPVDLHLSFALKLAGYLAEIQNELNKRGRLPSTPQARLCDWNVLQAYIPRTMPSQTVARGHGANRIGGGVGPGARSGVNRKRLEESLSAQGYKGIRLQKALAALLSIQAIAGGRLSGNNSYLEARRQLAMVLLADPAPMIREALKTVMERAPSYWADAVQAGGLPKERSEEWKEADRATERELTLFEAEAQLLARLEGELRKIHSGLTAADALSSERSPNLAQLLPVIGAAVGDGRTGSSPAFRRPQQTVRLFSEQHRVMDLLTRLENASYLRGGAEELLAIARARISSNDSPEAFRDAIPLRANVWFESGDYLKALDTLLTAEVPIALYSPTMSWRSLPGDVATKPLSVTARQEGSRIIFQAMFEGGKKADVLALEGLVSPDGDALLKGFSEIRDPGWSEYGKVSDQVLLTPVVLRPKLRELRELLLGPKLKTLLMKSMVYGHNAPGNDLVQNQDSTATVPERTVAMVDRVNGDQGRNYHVPSLDEVKQLANARTKTRQ